MRTTVNIEERLLRRLKSEARRNRCTLTEALNRILEAGLNQLHPASQVPPYVCPTYSMGFPPVGSMDKALQLAAALEDEEILRELQLGK